MCKFCVSFILKISRQNKMECVSRSYNCVSFLFYFFFFLFLIIDFFHCCCCCNFLYYFNRLQFIAIFACNVMVVLFFYSFSSLSDCKFILFSSSLHGCNSISVFNYTSIINCLFNFRLIFCVFSFFFLFFLV